MTTGKGMPALHVSRLPSRRVTRCVLVCVPGLLALGMAFALDVPATGELLVWGVDRNGWHFLAAAGAFLLLCTAICWIAVETARAAPRAWRMATAYIVVCVVVSGVLLIAWPAAIIGALSFSDEYRTIGTVDGRDLVVRNGFGLGDTSLQAGFRRGAFVEFGTTSGDTLVRNASQPLSDWTFSVRKVKDQVTIHYEFSPGGPGGTLRIADPA